MSQLGDGTGLLIQGHVLRGKVRILYPEQYNKVFLKCQSLLWEPDLLILELKQFYVL